VPLADVKGQGQAVEVLKRAIANDRVAPAYLFIGPEGVGKRTTALAFAMALLCQGARETADACGVCPSCRKVVRGSHPDLLLIGPDGTQIKIGKREEKGDEPPQIRQLIRAAHRRPYEGTRKVLVVDEAHKMNLEAANALLKTLEEPPPGTVILLIATTLFHLPATISSRCQVVRFRLLPRAWLKGWMEEVRGLSKEEADWVLPFCEGRMDRARDLDPKGVRDLWAETLGLLRAALAGRVEEILSGAAQAGRPRERAQEVLDILLILLRDLTVLSFGVPLDSLGEAPQEEDLSSLARTHPPKVWMHLFQGARRFRAELDRYSNPQLGWEVWSLQAEAAAARGPGGYPW
jgi:DNA polymerase-3 subunit delta'